MQKEGRALPARVVLMPCRALEAFRRCQRPHPLHQRARLNALSGIGGVQTDLEREAPRPWQAVS